MIRRRSTGYNGHRQTGQKLVGNTVSAVQTKKLADPENYKRFMDACQYMIEIIRNWEQAE